MMKLPSTIIYKFFKIIIKENIYNQLLISMSTKLSYQKLQLGTTPQLINKATNQQRFWKKYQNQQLLTSTSSINTICSNHNEKGLLILAHGRTVSIFDTNTKKIIRTLDNNQFPITATSIRKDGLVMALGDEQGKISIKDTKQKFNLRTFSNHKKRINCLDYHNQYLYSGGQDMTIRLYDISLGTIIHSYQNAHLDYIKCIKGLQNSYLLSGGYDGKIKLFDFRVHQPPQIQFDHICQVQHFDVFPSGMNFVVCGEKKLSSWDIRYEKSLYENIVSKKLLSCIRILSNNGSRVMTSSYDCHLKIYRSDIFELTYQQKLSSPILCFDINHHNDVIGIGLQSKKIIIKSKNQGNNLDNQDNDDEREIQDQIQLWFRNNQKKGQFAYNDKYFFRGMFTKPDNYDIKFQRDDNKKISQYDRYLKKFQYKKALLTSLHKKNMVIFLALVDQYQQRGCLDRVIKSFTQQQNSQLTNMLSELIHDIRYSDTVIYLLEKIVLYHESSTQIAVWNKLKSNINEEIQVVQSLGRISGMLDLIQKNCYIK